MKFVQEGAFLFQGRNQETLICFEGLRVTKTFGGQTMPLIYVTNAAQISCVNCYIADSTDFNLNAITASFDKLVAEAIHKDIGSPVRR